MTKRSRTVRLSLALGTVLLLAACASDFSREVNTYSVSDDGLYVQVSVSSCNEADLAVEAIEADDVVRITAQVDGDPRGGDSIACATIVDVTFDEPLGDRTVVDSSTNEHMELVP